MRIDMSLLRSVAFMVACLVAGHAARAQSAADGPVLGARHIPPTAAFKIWNPSGHVRLVGWDRDSIVVRGRIGKGAHFFMSGDTTAMKFGAEVADASANAGRADFVAYLPRRSRVSIKTVSAAIDGNGVSGWFYSVSGAIHLSGAATSIEAESMNGNLDLDVTTPWLRGRTGDGHLLLRGRPEDVDVATISGTLDIATTTALRGQFSSVSGDIHYVGTLAPGGIFEFSNHSGAVDMLLPQNASGAFTLSSITGSIENGFAGVRPISSAPHSMRLTLGRGGASVTVRTFKGVIRLRPE
jgi:hypothetical protein